MEIKIVKKLTNCKLPVSYNRRSVQMYSFFNKEKNVETKILNTSSINFVFVNQSMTKKELENI